MRNKSRRHLTLIEVVIALGIASVLLGVFFPYMLDTIRFKKKIEKEKLAKKRLRTCALLYS